MVMWIMLAEMMDSNNQVFNMKEPLKIVIAAAGATHSRCMTLW